MEQVGEYCLVRLLGKGGMGEVHEARASDGRTCALKVFSAEKGNVDFLRRRFAVEGKLLAKLSHPRLVHVHDLGVDDKTGRPYFAMDLVLDADGNATTLEDRRLQGRVSEADAERWYGDLVEALSYCHAKGVVHRDVKLNNVLVDAEGHAVLSDFGVSRIFDSGVREELQVTTTFIEGETTGTRPVMGTYWYLSPEVRRGGAATAASDWYALGVTFYRLLTGMWYEPGTDALELLAPYAPVWRERLEKLLEGRLRATEEVRPRPRHWRWRLALVAVVGMLIGGWWWTSSHRVQTELPARLVFELDGTNRMVFCRCPGSPAYALGETPVTRRQWFSLRGEPVVAWEGGEDAPMTYITRDEVTNCCARLNARFARKLPKGYEVRLPKHAEWSAAYRAGPIIEGTNCTVRRSCGLRWGWFGQALDGNPWNSEMRKYYVGRGFAIPWTTNIWKNFPPHRIKPGKDDWVRLSSWFAPVPAGLKPANSLGLKDLCGNCYEMLSEQVSDRFAGWYVTEFGISMSRSVVNGRSPRVSDFTVSTGGKTLMAGTYLVPDFVPDEPWAAPFERLPHLGVRLCIGKKENPADVP